MQQDQAKHVKGQTFCRNAIGQAKPMTEMFCMQVEGPLLSLHVQCLDRDTQASELHIMASLRQKYSLVPSYKCTLLLHCDMTAFCCSVT